MQCPVVVLLLVAVGLSYASGAQTRSRRLVGGFPAQNVPWQVLLHFGDSVLDGGIGGGALITQDWILTSGRNLFVNKTKQPTKREPTVLPKVYVGITNRKTLDPDQTVEVDKVVLHPDFQKSSNWDNNLALIRLKKALVMSDKVQPIPLHDQDLVEKDGTRGVVSGWGWGALLSFSDLLKYLVVSVVDRDVCQATYLFVDGDHPVVDSRSLCTNATDYEENVCFGDEGSALAILDPPGGVGPDSRRVYIAGILSYDKSCRSGYYAIYTKVSAYREWIISVLRGDSENSETIRTTAMRQMLERV